jgi:hypothetical protein
MKSEFVPKFVRRDKELKAITTHLQGKPPFPVFFLTGEGGSGKTTLLRTAQREITKNTKINPIFIDCKNFMHNTVNLVQKLKEGTGIIEKDTVIFIDTFELMSSVENELIAKLHTLSQRTPVIIASRKKPSTAQETKITKLKPFDLATIEAYIKESGLSADIARQAYQFSKGNPLLLNLFMMAAAKSKKHIAIDKKALQSNYVSFIISEVTSEDVFMLLEAASIVHSFNSDLLGHMLSRPIGEKAYQELIGLSFVSKNEDYWQIHDVVGQSISQSLKEQAPQRYYSYKKRALRFYNLLQQNHPDMADEINLYRIYLCEDEFARTIFFNLGTDFSDNNLSVSPAEKEDLYHVMQIWKQAFQPMGYSKEQIAHAASDTENLIRHTSPFIRILKDKDKNILGYHCTIPACSATMKYLLHSPATKSYFFSLPAKELKMLKKADVHSTDTFFIRHFTPVDVNNFAIQGALLQDLTKCYLRDGVRIITTIPHHLFHSLVEGLGFRRLPGIYDTAFDTPLPAYELDFRRTAIELWYEWLAMGRILPHWLNSLLTGSKEGWQELVNEVLDNLNDVNFLACHPLAPLALEMQDASLDKDHASGNALHKLITELINEDFISKKQNRRSAGEILKVTYLHSESREKAAEILDLPPSTYYRQLKKARRELANRLFDKAAQLAENKYVHKEKD